MTIYPDSAKLDPHKPAQPYMRFRRLRRFLYRALVSFLALSFLVGVALFYLGTDSGLKKAVPFIKWASADSIHIENIEGSLWAGSVTIQALRFRRDTVNVFIESLEFRWQPKKLLLANMVIDYLGIGSLRIDTISKPNIPVKATQAPHSLNLPIGVQISKFSLSRLSLNNDKAIFTDMTLSLSSDRTLHRFSLHRATSAAGKVRGHGTLSGIAPFATQIQMELAGAVASTPMVAKLEAAGTLRQLYIITNAQSQLFHADADVVLDIFAPYQYEIIRHGKIEVKNLDPSLLNSAAPQAKVSLKAQVISGPLHTTGVLFIENKLPGAINLHKIPIKNLRMDWKINKPIPKHAPAADHILDMTHIKIEPQGQGYFQGAGILKPNTFEIKLAANTVNLHDILSTQKQSSVNGSIRLHGQYHIPALEIKLEDTLNQLQLLADTQWRTSSNEHTLVLNRLSLTQLKQGSAKLHLKGEVGMLGNKAFNIETRMADFNPAYFGHYPTGNLNMAFQARGVLLPELNTHITYVFEPSTFNRSALSGKGDMIVQGAQLNYADVTLSLGNNKLSIKGKLGVSKNDLTLLLDLSNLAQIGSSFAGSMQGNINIKGELSKPLVKAQLKVSQLKSPWGIEAHSLNIESNLAPDIKAPMQLSIVGKSIKAAQLHLSDINMQIKGTQAHHHIHVYSQGDWGNRPLFVQSGFTGKLNKINDWQGEIRELKAGFANGKLALQAPTKLRFNSNHLTLDQAMLTSKNSHITIQNLIIHDKKLKTEGQVNRLNVADILAWLPIKSAHASMIITGQWRITADETINGEIKLKRHQGNITWHPSESRSIGLAVSNLNLNTIIKQNAVSIAADLVTNAGDLKANIATRLSRQGEQWGIYNHSPLNAHVQGTLSSLESLGPLIDSNLKLAGNLAIDVTRIGTLDKGTVSGVVKGKNLSIKNPIMGINLEEGVANTRLNTDYIIFDELRFKGGMGSLSAKGKMGLNNRNASIKIIADRLHFLSRPDMKIILSGQSDMFVTNGELMIQGQVKIDEAKIRTNENYVPHLSDDVIIMGQSRIQQSTPENFTLAALHFDVDLGNKTVYKGKGAKVLLGGKLHIMAEAKQPIYASGTVHITKGSYKAYGQNLTVRQGFIAFQGPLENPSLDITATRQGLPVEAGVHIAGTAIQPRLTLISDPNVPDNEKISWIMFGKAIDTLNPQDSASVLAVASSLLTGEGPSLQKRIAKKFGLDELALNSGNTADTLKTTYLTLSKRLTNNLYLSFEQSLGDIDSALKLQYIFSRYWRAVARAGKKETTFDIFYTLSFD